MNKKPNLRKWLDTTSTSTDVLAQKSGVSRQSISYFLNGKTTLTWKNARKIWVATGYEVRFISLYPDAKKEIEAISHIKKEDVCESIGDK